MEIHDFIAESIDPDKAQEWEIISISTLCAEKFRSEVAQQEIIRAYIKAAQTILDAMTSENNPPHMKVFRVDQMCLPFLFLCRHSIELAIKYRLYKRTGTQRKSHNLKELWDKLCEDKLCCSKLTTFSPLVDVLDQLDGDGCHMRYSVDTKGVNYQKEPMFVKVGGFMSCSKQLIDLLLKN